MASGFSFGAVLAVQDRKLDERNDLGEEGYGVPDMILRMAPDDPFVFSSYARWERALSPKREPKMFTNICSAKSLCGAHSRKQRHGKRQARHLNTGYRLSRKCTGGIKHEAPWGLPRLGSGSHQALRTLRTNPRKPPRSVELRAVLDPLCFRVTHVSAQISSRR